MRINYGQILFTILSLLVVLAAYNVFTKEEPEVQTYMIVTDKKKIEYIRTPESLFLKDTSGCVTNGKEVIQCGVKHLTLLIDE